MVKKTAAVVARTLPLKIW